MQVRLRQQVFAVLRDEADHVVVVPVLLVHVDGEVGLLDHEVQLLGLLQLPRTLQPLRLRHVYLRHLLGGHVSDGNLVCLVPLVCSRVHLDSLLAGGGLDVVPLRLLVVFGLLEVLRDDLEEALRHLGLLHVDDLDGLAPLARLDGRLDRLHVLPRLDVVVDRRVQLLLALQPHPPLVLQLHHLVRKLAARELDGAPVRMPFAIRLQRALGVVQLLEKRARLVMQPRFTQRPGNRLEHFGGLRELGVLRERCGACGEAALEVELDGTAHVALLLLELCCFFLLRCHEQPVEVRGLELLGVLAVLALGDCDRLVPPVQLLVHLHRLLHLALLEQQLLCAVEVLVESRHARLHHEVLRAVLHKPLPLRLLRKLVDTAQVHRLPRVPQRRRTSLCDEELVVGERELLERGPHGLCLGRVVQLLQQRHRPLVVLEVDAHAKLDERLVEAVRHCVDALVDDHLRAPPRALDVLDVALDLEDGDPLGRIDGVPDAEVVTVLRHHHVRVRHPLHVARVVEQCRPCLRRDVVQVQVPALVAEEELCC
mmetsp:Transcript_68183/g.142092  ORF Transcript_68183/g.142092 Transcript_68183/m.142092 type:complete len:539 (-) Transcript_68183:434-2050(-)